MAKHNLDKLPSGFRPTLWAEVNSGETVFVQDSHGKAQGPYWVVDPDRYLLRQTDGQTFTHDGSETLLYRKGPLAVVQLLPATRAVVYCDVPLEVYITIGGDGFGGIPARPLDFQEMPDRLLAHVNEAMPPGWPAMFGAWDVSAVVAAHNVEDGNVELRVNQRATATALCAELLRQGLIFRCQPLDDKTFVFTVTRKVLQHITQHLRRLIPEDRAYVS